MSPFVEIAGIYMHHDAAEASFRPEDEYVVLVNTGSVSADLARWSLTNRKTDRIDHYRYLFPRFLSNGDPWLLEPGGLVLLYTGRGTNGSTATVGEAPQLHLYQHRPERVWCDPGDIACLYDQGGRLISALALNPVRDAV